MPAGPSVGAPRRVRALCRPELAAGLRLAGLEPEVTTEPAVAFLARLRAEGRTGVLLVQQTLHAGLPRETGRAAHALPLVVALPDPGAAEGPSAAEEELLEIVRQAVGYRVRLR